MLGKYVRVRIEKPIGSTDEAGFTYPLNFGSVYNEENQDAFIMGIHHPVKNFDGRVIAILSDRNRIMQKKELESTNAKWNEYLNGKGEHNGNMVL